jgi:hypothetical protein
MTKVPQPTDEKFHVYRVHDGGESIHWAATSEGEALALHRKHWVEPSGDPEDPSMRVEAVDDAELLEVDTQDGNGSIVEQTCAGWAKDAARYPVPMVCSSVY